jgi:hypothetical protein
MVKAIVFLPPRMIPDLPPRYYENDKIIWETKAAA